MDSLLDLRALEELHMMLGADLLEIVEQLTQQLPEQRRALNGAIETGDLAAVGAIAHSIKGGAGNLGGRMLSMKAAQLERAALGADLEASVALSAELAELVPSTILALQSFFAARSGA
ncbi:MAG: Hpt domain-containing protein [Azoarcus sp.]|nr:Hpt domain-containing protein [Azoarcus sp.]